VTEEQRANQWIVGRDTGTSSETIWAVMRGVQARWASPPSDPSDFGRCYRLLKLIPEWRRRLSEVCDAHPEWSALIEHWDELTVLYEDELENGPVVKWTRMAPKTYERMKQLIDDGRRQAGWKERAPGCWDGPTQRVTRVGEGASFTHRS
jgi:hypothetical protein